MEPIEQSVCSEIVNWALFRHFEGKRILSHIEMCESYWKDTLNVEDLYTQQHSGMEIIQ